MVRYSVQIEMKAKTNDGINPQNLGQMLFALRQRCLGRDDDLTVRVSAGVGELAVHMNVFITFELTLEELIAAIPQLQQMDVHFIPDLTGKGKKECAQHLGHEKAYRVQEIRA